MHSSKNIDTCSRNSETGPRGISYARPTTISPRISNAIHRVHNALECRTSVELYIILYTHNTTLQQSQTTSALPIGRQYIMILYYDFVLSSSPTMTVETKTYYCCSATILLKSNPSCDKCPTTPHDVITIITTKTASGVTAKISVQY